MQDGDCAARRRLRREVHERRSLGLADDRRTGEAAGLGSAVHSLFQGVISKENHMRYELTPIHCRPWTLNALSFKLIESHYENNYGGALRRLNAITEKLESLDFDK